MINGWVIAGSNAQFLTWMQSNQHKYPNVRLMHVSNANVIRGFTNPHGIFVGTWLDRPDIEDILMVLWTSTHETNEGLSRALELFKERKRK